MQEVPRLARLYEYWMNWYRVRRADWQTRLWLEQVKSRKAQIKQWEAEGVLNDHLVECERISKDADVVEDGMKIIQTELQETLELAREREWHVRYPKPQTTMEGWIGTIHERYKALHYWIRKIREELPHPWVDFVYVIYYAYVAPGEERHLEAHFEGKLINTPKIYEKVKEYANKLLRAFVKAPRVVAGEIRPGYETPLLQKGGLRPPIDKPPYEGEYAPGNDLWQWGIEIGKIVNDEERLEETEPEAPTAEKTVTLRCEIYDYDYGGHIRGRKEVTVQATWWELSLMELLEIFGLEAER